MVLNMMILNQPSAQPSINREISKIVLNVVLKNLSNFQQFQTEEFFVSGNAWQIQFRKTAANSLGICLQSNNIFLGRTEKLIVARCNVRLLSPSPLTDMQLKSIDIRPFSSQNLYWGINKFIAWDELMNDYVAEDSCKLKIEVEATQLLNAARNNWLQFEEMAFDGQSDLVQHKKFRMTINQIHIVVGVCSPNILLNGSSWVILVEKKEDLVLVTILNTTKNTCRVSAAIKLISFDRNIQSLTVVNAMQEFNAEDFHRSWNIRMDDLLDPEKQFVEDGQKFVIEIELNNNDN